MIIHPPMLYMGYVGFSVAFAFAIAALLSGQLDAAWARWSRPWTTTAWVFLTLGIALGSWWAYYELGWGGWWFWDPVENASFMPWLVGTALIHSLAVTEKRGSFKNWTVLLAIAAFSLSLLGTFLVRSGVLTSVHAFATDPAPRYLHPAAAAIVVGFSSLLFACARRSVGLGGRFGLVSRETLLLANNVLLVVATGSVLLGTLYPLFLDALGLGKISVGPPYFDAVFVPLMVPLLILMAPGPLARWKHADMRPVLKQLVPAFVAALLLGVAVPLLYGGWSRSPRWACCSPPGSQAHRRGDRRAPARRAVRPAAALVGHAPGARRRRRVRRRRHDGVVLSGGEGRAHGAGRHGDGGRLHLPLHRRAQGNGAELPGVGELELSRDGKVLRTMKPEKRAYLTSAMPMTEAAIDTGLLRDVYVSLGEPIDERAWSVRVYYKPFVDWIWGGCLLMALGGIVAISDRRYRLKRRAAALQGATA
jgi:cytochrome c-type biogenesis protein CcmF